MTDDERYELYPYQNTGAEFLAGRNYALLGDPMGVGKTPQAIRATDLVFADRILVVCPSVARINWQREFGKFSLLAPTVRVCVALADKPAEHGVTVVSYDYATNSRHLKGTTWDILIADEAHFMMNPEAQRTKVILGKTGLVHRAKKTWLLTGTPMPSHAGNLWPMLRAGGVTALKYHEFIRHFCTGFDGGFGFKITGVKNVPELKQLLGKIMLRRRKEDVLKELPPISFSTFTVDPGPVDMEVYMFELWLRSGGTDKLAALIDRQERHLADQIELLKASARTPMRALVSVMAGMQSNVNELRQYTGLAKVASVVDKVKAELNTPKEDGGIDKIVLFCVHRHVIELLRLAFGKYGALTLYGGMSPEGKQKHIDAFQTNPKKRVFIANIAAAGTAINLTAAAEALFVELDWTPANNAQAAMRVHRIGQERPVRVRYAALADSTDEYVTETLRRKTRDELAIFGK